MAKKIEKIISTTLKAVAKPLPVKGKIAAKLAPAIAKAAVVAAKPTPITPAARPTPAPASAKVASAKPPAAKATFAKPSEPSFQEIQMQAYFVAEHRHAQGLPGDAASDWVEAEKQLRASK